CETDAIAPPFPGRWPLPCHRRPGRGVRIDDPVLDAGAVEHAPLAFGQFSTASDSGTLTDAGRDDAAPEDRADAPRRVPRANDRGRRADSSAHRLWRAGWRPPVL